ncbi:hypothetical protein CXB51_014781 [Gossypium anomalum]|uniref:Aminotransferase-like plant mobile domain-containing protein n=1 Tax=Gossypium anomalum TaxID=47600 RepID=A0A8J5ZAM1_9ROSI|nr:hypothetical protein CXB51_014781 [Gossypium anomalum]
MVPNFFVCVSEEEERGKEKRREEEEEEEEGGGGGIGMATASLIKEDPHIADTVNKTVIYCYLLLTGYSPDARLIPYLELAGFGSAALIRTFDLRYDLISALVKRWRPETHTFHLPCGECTVTLEDVALQLGLPIDGSPVTGHLLDNATEEELMCAARAYIMHIIGGVLMPDANNNRVHIMYLPLLTDLHNVRSYSWGSAVLTMLYCELCRTTNPYAADIGGCLILLQSWALYQMPFLASVSHQPYVYPLVNRWSIYPGIGRSYTVPIYRLLIEQHAGEGFIWMPYRRPEIVAVIPSSAYVHSQLWCTNTPIINFNVVEWCHGDRVLWQFGCIQYIPDPPKEVGKVYCINKKWKHGMHWRVVHRRYIAVWDNRMGRRPRMDMSSDLQPSPEYMQWYFSMGKPYLLGAQSTPEAKSEQSHSHSADTSYHPDFPDNDYFPGSSGGGYHYGFDNFGSSPSQHSTSLGLYPPQYSTSLGPYPPQYSTPPGMYPLQHGTPPGSSSSMPFEPYDFSSMYQTPSPTTEEDVGRRDHPQREHRPPNRYTPRTTPSNHQL